MRLKRLEILGFKSFRDKTVLDFSKGITAVVGPNGCGKSNIVDAIRWVMGEQRVRVLRGKKMDDLIFHGADGTSPVGLAEACLVFEADEGGFPGAYAECTEVMISRRLFRNGESEYAINGVSCRLIDVRDFLMAAGIGARTYSVVEQNSIVSLVEAKPEERRQFIEDAAGVSKYKARKEAAIRKMEATSQNLTRLNDIIREVKAQLNSVSRHAKRAEQYKALKKEIKEAEITLAVQSYTDFQDQQSELTQQLLQLREEENRLHTTLVNLEATMEVLRSELLSSEAQSARSQETLYEIRRAISLSEKEIEHARAKVAELSSRKVQSEAEIEALKTRRESLFREIDGVVVEIKTSDERLDQVRRDVLLKQREIEALRSTVRSLQDEIEDHRAELIEVVTEKARLKNTLVVLKKTKEDLVRRREKDLREIKELKERCEARVRDLEALRQTILKDGETLDRLRKDEERLTDQWENEKRRLKDIEELVAKLREDIGKKSSRLSSLKEMMEGYSWCSEGPKSIMTLARTGREEELPEGGCLGLVADIIQVPREYEKAAEAVLGEKLQYIVVKSQQDGVRAIDYLKSKCLGRGTFVPLEVRNDIGHLPGREECGKAFRLIDAVTVQKGYERVAEYFLGDVLVIPDLTYGITLWERNGFQGTLVTPEGDIIHRHGALTGGSSTNGERSHLSLRRELAEMQEEVERMRVVLTEKMNLREVSSNRIEHTEKEIHRLRSEIHSLELLLNGKRKDQERHESEVKALEQRLSVLMYNYETLTHEENDAEETLEKVRCGILECEEREKTLETALGFLRERWDEAARDVSEAEEHLTKEKIFLASLEEKRRADVQKLARLEADKARINDEIEKKTKELELCIRGIKDSQVLMEREEKKLARLLEECDSAAEFFEKARGIHQEKEDLLRVYEVEAKGIKKTFDEVRRKSGEIELASRDIALRMESLRRGIREKYYSDLESFLSGFKPLEEEAVRELVTRLEKNKQSVENFGEVNLLAMSEYEQLKERYDFLTKQVSDLNSSMDSLRRAIAKINAVSQQRFGEAFEAINEHFKVVFSRIFPGGRGELILTDEEDLLETGVDISIALRGKRAQSVNLLSGGEKALAAIALIFAIVMYRPSPFLVLDEVDAALDDRNIGLFGELVKDISANSQIIIVTHNRKTMEIAEYLFGVTLQKQGISTLVSVSLH